MGPYKFPDGRWLDEKGQMCYPENYQAPTLAPALREFVRNLPRDPTPAKTLDEGQLPEDYEQRQIPTRHPRAETPGQGTAGFGQQLEKNMLSPTKVNETAKEVRQFQHNSNDLRTCNLYKA
jgi:hypothetical protein